MMIEQSLLPQRLRIRMSAPLTREARQRLRWMEFYEAHGRNARLTCRRFGISSATFYRWRRRYTPRRLSSLEDDRRTRRPPRALQEAYPRWGKVKLAVLLAREGWEVSASTVGRTLGRLRALGQLREPAEVRPGLRRVHFSACDVVSRKGVVAAHDRGSSRAAERVLREAFPRFGFPVRAIQIDGGSEFKAVFEAACERMGIRLFVLPPRSPKLNGHVERAQRTHQEEFYDLVEVPDPLAEHNALLQEWERTYNTVRPHQALGYRTPQEYLTQWQTQHHDQ